MRTPFLLLAAALLAAADASPLAGTWRIDIGKSKVVSSPNPAELNQLRNALGLAEGGTLTIDASTFELKLGGSQQRGLCRIADASPTSTVLVVGGGDTRLHYLVKRLSPTAIQLSGDLAFVAVFNKVDGRP